MAVERDETLQPITADELAKIPRAGQLKAGNGSRVAELIGKLRSEEYQDGRGCGCLNNG